MADLNLLGQVVGAAVRNQDLTQFAVIVGSLKVGTTGVNTQLTKSILDNLITLQNGSDILASLHHHDNRYYTKTQLGSTASATTSGAFDIGVFLTATNYTASAQNVEAHLAGINSALASVASNNFDDSLFRIDNHADSTKKIAFSAAGISTATTRTITMPDADVDLGNLTNSNISASAAIAYSKLNLSGSIVNADINASAAIAYSKLASLGGSTNAVLIQSGSGFVSASSILSTNLFLADGSVSATGAFNLNSHKITNLTAGSVSGDAVNYGQVILTSGANAFGADQSMGGFKLTNLATPLAANDAASKSYVDSAMQGVSWKTLVRSATTGALAANTYNNGASGVGATLTGNSNGALAAQDGVTLVVNDRLLVKNEATSANNGIYVVTQVGSGGTPYILTRAVDMDASTEFVGATVEVGTEASTQPKYLYFQNTAAPITVGTTAISWILISSALVYTFTSGVQLSGSTVSANVDNLTIDVNGSNQLEVKAGGITNTQVSASAAIAYSKLSLSNSIVNADINASAAIAYSKLNLSGSIVNADINASAAIVYSKLSLSNSIVNADINSAAAIAYSKLNLSGSIVNADIASGAAIAYSKLNLSNSIVAGDLTANSVTAAKVNTGVFDQSTITGGNGSAAVVQNAPQVVRAGLIAGQSFSANTTYAVRWGQPANGETAGRLYAADKNAASQSNFNCVGVIQPTGAISAGGSVNLIKEGGITQVANDTAFGSNDVGTEAFVGSSGVIIAKSALSGSTNEAAFVVGIIQTTTSIDVGGMHLRGIA